MQIAKYLDSVGQPRAGVVDAGRIVPRLDIAGRPATLSVLLTALQSGRIDALRVDFTDQPVELDTAHLLPPLDNHEVWGAGVTYLRSKQAREEESEQAASFYDQVYQADRPELFFKATPSRVVGPGVPIRARSDSNWTVPEPELALVLSPALEVVGYTLGNDVSARDIEGRNPLYLPQAKVYDACCALGPVITSARALPPIAEVEIRLTIRRGGSVLFESVTSVGRMARTFEELIDWLGRDNSFPDGVILLTGTGIVPPDDLSLQAGDEVVIESPAIGRLVNPVVKG
jgi:2-dehydro-3-deoxy-D-arabinonate dehydratase